MSAGVLSPTVASRSGSAAAFCGNTTPGDVVEIGLLLPAEWAALLMDLAKERQESVGQLLRTVIGRALAEKSAVV